jgi:hypothetical protein
MAPKLRKSLTLELSHDLCVIAQGAKEHAQEKLSRTLPRVMKIAD